ncbi:hypothetical protein P5W98_00790 [Paraburkholderia sp. A1BS-2L]|uniref:hypothetical protein n=1 Tax=Paraburkholderia sp. A1BS-2L TaxID=3028373 RepID=UPI003DA963E9
MSTLETTALSDSQLLSIAASRAMDAMQATWECVSLYFWRGTDAEDLFIWLGEDHPELASAIWQRDLYSAFKERIVAAVQLTCNAELFVWKELDNVRDTIVSAPHEQQLSRVRAMTRGDRYIDADRVYDNENDDEDYDDVDGPYIDASGAIHSNFSWRGGGPGFGEYANDAVARETLRILRGRQVYYSSNGNAPVTSAPSWETDESTPILSEVRNGLTLQSTCVIVAREALPAALRNRTVERRCVVVRIDDAWFRNAELLEQPGTLEHQLTTRSGRTVPMSIWTLPNNAVWFEREIALDAFRRFRRELPVLYVGSKTSRLVLHPFDHWADLYWLHQDWRHANTCAHKWDPSEFEPPQTELPDGTVLVPSGKTNLLDISEAEA